MDFPSYNYVTIKEFKIWNDEIMMIDTDTTWSMLDWWDNFTPQRGQFSVVVMFELHTPAFFFTPRLRHLYKSHGCSQLNSIYNYQLVHFTPDKTRERLQRKRGLSHVILSPDISLVDANLICNQPHLKLLKIPKTHHPAQPEYYLWATSTCRDRMQP